MKTARTLIIIVAAMAVCASSASLRAEDWKTTDGKAYQNVEVVATRPDMVTIVHKDGVSMVPLTTLSPDLQKRFNYDPAKAKAFADDRAKLYAANELEAQAEKIRAAKKLKAESENPTSDQGTGATEETSISGNNTSGMTTPALVFGGTGNSIDSLGDFSLSPDPSDTNHHSINDLSGSMHTVRHDLSDPTYHTMAHLALTVQSLGPDPNDKNHHSMDEISGH